MARRGVDGDVGGRLVRGMNHHVTSGRESDGRETYDNGEECELLNWVQHTHFESVGERGALITWAFKLCMR